MSTLASTTTSTVIVCMSYRDAPAAIEWLCRNFDFVQRAVHRDDGGLVVHAELTFGNGMIMLGSVKESEYGRLIRQPEQIAGFVTQSVYVITSAPDEIYRRVKAAGARILIDIRNEDYGSRGFTCADPEGHVWTFGTYDPWKAAGGG